MRTPSSALPAWPQGLALGRGKSLTRPGFAGAFLALSFTTFLAAGFFFATGFCRALVDVLRFAMSALVTCKWSGSRARIRRPGAVEDLDVFQRWNCLL